MGPQRKDWTFPKRADVLIDALEDERDRLIKLIGEKLTEEQDVERRIEEYRNKLALAGVENADRAYPEGIKADYYNTGRRTYQGHAKALDEVEMYLRALKDDFERDPNRMYKLLASDLEWFNL